MRIDGSTLAVLNCSTVSPAHLVSNVCRCQSSQPSSISRSGATKGSEARAMAGAVQSIVMGPILPDPLPRVAGSRVRRRSRARPRATGAAPDH
ncbi:hypothetical protein JCM9533A_71810 [Catenuloplanes niger JCM 9533]